MNECEEIVDYISNGPIGSTGIIKNTQCCDIASSYDLSDKSIKRIARLIENDIIEHVFQLISHEMYGAPTDHITPFDPSNYTYDLKKYVKQYHNKQEKWLFLFHFDSHHWLYKKLKKLRWSQHLTFLSYNNAVYPHYVNEYVVGIKYGAPPEFNYCVSKNENGKIELRMENM